MPDAITALTLAMAAPASLKNVIDIAQKVRGWANSKNDAEAQQIASDFLSALLGLQSDVIDLQQECVRLFEENRVAKNHLKYRAKLIRRIFIAPNAIRRAILKVESGHPRQRTISESTFKKNLDASTGYSLQKDYIKPMQPIKYQRQEQHFQAGCHSLLPFISPSGTKVYYAMRGHSQVS